MLKLNELKFDGIVEWLREHGEKPYRARQIFRWLWEKGETDISNYSDISKALREKLKQEFEISWLKVLEVHRSADGSAKFLFELPDGEMIESVFIPDGKRKTVCVSSQVGCPLKCTICATGLMGFRRNLAAWEIASQVVEIRKTLKLERVTNVVFMGMGEPFLNIEEVLQAVLILNNPWGLRIGARKITLSTVGIIPGIYRLINFEKQVKLAISLHSAIQEKREKIAPIAKKYPLPALKEALRNYCERTKRRVTIEYVLLPGFNDHDEDIDALLEFIKGLTVKINVIPFNPYPGLPYRAPTAEEIGRFMGRLYELPLTVTLRASRGRDVKGACGQLAIEKR